MFKQRAELDSTENTFCGAEELWIRLDTLAQATLGVSAAEFVEGYPRGRFARMAIANDLAALVPFAASPHPAAHERG